MPLDVLSLRTGRGGRTLVTVALRAQAEHTPRLLAALTPNHASVTVRGTIAWAWTPTVPTALPRRATSDLPNDAAAGLRRSSALCKLQDKILQLLLCM